MEKRRIELIECRKLKGTRDDVSSELGISNVYLRMIETGALKPGRDLMIRMSIYFGKPIDVLFPDLFIDDGVV
ncbi:helix-turn-helix transcriptional regulator [Paenibacillus larvae]|uniref:Helix-turn-helix protein n=1 Tax=Paenibacillus larvae subsp. larvae TaxID=147375 RepID=A0A6C0QU66_9BACL|nr:helix-turn-helix transcriptional regulator [Paenibacillus larvae]QHZ52202.1 helix-turn-helix protein [Paenibacillus larvae subsp. larvae]